MARCPYMRDHTSFGFANLAAAIQARIQIDMVGAAQLSQILVLDIRRWHTSASAERRIPRRDGDVFRFGTAMFLLLNAWRGRDEFGDGAYRGTCTPAPGFMPHSQQSSQPRRLGAAASAACAAPRTS